MSARRKPLAGPRTRRGALPVDQLGTEPLALDFGHDAWTEPTLLDLAPELTPAPDDSTQAPTLV